MLKSLNFTDKFFKSSIKGTESSDKGLLFIPSKLDLDLLIGGNLVSVVLQIVLSALLTFLFFPSSNNNKKILVLYLL